jgi:hypothetical protein
MEVGFIPLSVPLVRAGGARLSLVDNQGLLAVANNRSSQLGVTCIQTTKCEVVIAN